MKNKEKFAKEIVNIAKEGYGVALKNGKVYTWYKGATSWSTDNSGLITYWETAKLAEQEEERIEKS